MLLHLYFNVFRFAFHSIQTKYAPKSHDVYTYTPATQCAFRGTNRIWIKTIDTAFSTSSHAPPLALRFFWSRTFCRNYAFRINIRMNNWTSRGKCDQVLMKYGSAWKRAQRAFSQHSLPLYCMNCINWICRKMGSLCLGAFGWEAAQRPACSSGIYVYVIYSFGWTLIGQNYGRCDLWPIRFVSQPITFMAGWLAGLIWTAHSPICTLLPRKRLT